MKLVELTEFLVKNLVRDPESVSVREISDDEEIIIEVLVSEDEIGAVIGKGGSIANAIRTLVYASSYVNGGKKVRINIDSI
ncbi:MAG: KH domain-containing protein [Firmicutes bacterium]|nr:KH domain-containing protein [Bacillota bacterium]